MQREGGKGINERMDQQRTHAKNRGDWEHIHTHMKAEELPQNSLLSNRIERRFFSLSLFLLLF
jgi:hypothetical protein